MPKPVRLRYQRRFYRKCAGNSDPLTLTAGKFMWITVCKEYAYPGNIHELYNLSCSLFTRYNSHKLQLSDLPTYLRSRQMADVSLTDLQYQVLSFVSTHPKAGRLAIKNGLADGETFVSEAALRTVLGELSSAGYLIVHRTKGGCEISELGRMVLEK